MPGKSLLLVPVAVLALLSTEALGQFLGRTSGSSNQQAAGAALPSDFRGRITYQGNFSGRRTEPGRAPRRLDLRSIANSGGRTIEFAGPAAVEVEYEGSVVRATYTADGRRGGFTGTRSDSDCRVVDTGDGGVGTFRCDRTGFSGTFESAPGARATYRTSVETHATRIIDAIEEERQQRAAVATREREAAERARDQAVRDEARRQALANPRTIEDMSLRAQEEVNSGNINAAVAWATRAMRTDRPHGRYLLGWVYRRHGQNLVEQGRYGEAIPYLRSAVANGNGLASMVLGRLYYYGNGVTADRARARQFVAAGIEAEEASPYRDQAVVADGRETLDFIDNPQRHAEQWSPPQRPRSCPGGAGQDVIWVPC